MEITVIGVVVFIALVAFRFLRATPKPVDGPVAPVKKVRPAGTARAAKRGNHQSYRSVSVRCGPGACDAALALGKRRFLTGQLRKLPLQGCTSSDCGCTFEHHPDRRDSEGDQRAPSALSSELYTAAGKAERRARRGRRGDDIN